MLEALPLGSYVPGRRPTLLRLHWKAAGPCYGSTVEIIDSRCKLHLAPLTGKRKTVAWMVSESSKLMLVTVGPRGLSTRDKKKGQRPAVCPRSPNPQLIPDADSELKAYCRGLGRQASFHGCHPSVLLGGSHSHCSFVSVLLSFLSCFIRSK